MVVTRSQSRREAVTTTTTTTTTTKTKTESKPPRPRKPHLATRRKPKQTQTPKKKPHPPRERDPSPSSPTNTPSTAPRIQMQIHPRSPAHYGLIQERIAHLGSYALLVQAILWNQTHGRQARPILTQLLALHPTPASLAGAAPSSLAALLQPIGLHHTRAARLLALAHAWLAAPPCRERRYRRLHYPRRGCGMDVGPREVLALEDPRVGWEVAHLPGVGPYALDSWRIFARDEMRGVVVGVDAGVEGEEAEWRRVVPEDKELRPYLKWRWRCEGWDWDPLTGRKVGLEGGAGGSE